MKFTKMHGCGNDYVYVNGMREQIASDKKPEMVRKLSDRHFGIGADGVIFINQGKQAMFVHISFQYPHLGTALARCSRESMAFW